MPVDCIDNPLGIRKFELHHDLGFSINGKPVKLIGLNRHQHYAYIGDAVPKSLHRKDALQIREAGFNVIRLAHYPHDNAFIEACDELGILLYEEAPTWMNIGGEKWNENLVEALRRAIRNHRNHPSIFAWGGGINHRGTYEPLHYAAKDEDPVRWTGTNHAYWTGSQRSDVCDFFSNMDYNSLPEPDEPMFAIESRMWPQMLARYKANPRRFGMAIWTAHAYYSFHPPKASQVNRTRGGIMSIFRVPGGTYYRYKSELTTEPMVYIQDAWSEGVERLRVFSNCDEVELVVNGVSLGKRTPDADEEIAALDHPGFTFPVSWEDGEVVAKGWKDGKVQATSVAHTPGTPVRIDLTVDMDGRDFLADGSDIVVAHAQVVDANGTRIKSFAEPVTCTVEGPAAVIGGPDIGANPMECLKGVATFLVRAGFEAGTTKITADCEGLASDSVSFDSIPSTDDAVAASAYPIYDLPRVRLDLGGPLQHVQYGLTGWMGENGSSEAVLALPQFGAAKATLHAPENEQLWWRGESNVPGVLGYVGEDGVCALGEITLDLEGLPAGTYRFRTYHHGPQSASNGMDPLRGKEYVVDISKFPPAPYLDVDVTDADEESRNVASSIAQGKGKSMIKVGPTCVDTRLSADGVSPVRILIRAKDGDGSVWLNGIDLEQRP